MSYPGPPQNAHQPQFQQYAYGPPPQTTPPSTPVWRKPWALAVGTGVLGLIIGVAAGGGSEETPDPTESSAYKSVSEKLDAAEAAADEANTKAAGLEDQVETIAGEIPSLQNQLETDQEQLAADQAALKSSTGKVKSREKAVGRREKAVGLVEDEIASNTIGGNGTFEVGVDMKPGTYKSAGSSGCYSQVSSDVNGNDILSNDFTTGPAVVQVAEGQYFETSECAEWVLQR